MGSVVAAAVAPDVGTVLATVPSARGVVAVDFEAVVVNELAVVDVVEGTADDCVD